MKRILAFLMVFISLGQSFAWVDYNENPVDKCGLINLLDYKENLNLVANELQSNYPRLKKQVDNWIVKALKIINSNPKFNKNKVKLFKEIAQKTVDYAYDHNICQGTVAYLMLSYFAYSFWDL